MRKGNWSYRVLIAAFIGVIATVSLASASNEPLEGLDLFHYALIDTPPPKGEDLPYPIKDDDGNYPINDNSSKVDLKDPAVIQQKTDYDPNKNQYILSKTLGEGFYRSPQYISFEDYLEYEYKNNEKKYWTEKSDIRSELLRRKVRPRSKDQMNLEEVFPEDFIQIKPSGSVEMEFAVKRQTTDNPALDRRLQRPPPQFDYNQDIRANISGKIGDFINLKFNFDTKATFEMDEQLRLAYTGKEDQIVKKFEAGNINFPLQTSLISGSQSLFGFKTELQFGRLTMTTAIASQRGKNESITIKGGAQQRDFEFRATDYDANRHFFLSHFFRNQYERNVKDAPAIVSLFKITRIEVWVTNDNRTAENSRDIVALMDLGEPDSLYRQEFRPLRALGIPDEYLNKPSDSANALGAYVKMIRDQGVSISPALINGQYKMEKINEFMNIYARMLRPTEYTLNANLGYISLNRRLQNDEVLAVAYEYTYKGKVYRVGEFSNEKQASASASENNSQTQAIDPNNPNAVVAGQPSSLLILKMLKSTALNPKLPMWDLMMKNIYNLNAFQLSRKMFFLDIFYQDPNGGAKRYLPTGSFRGTPLIQALKLDRLDNYMYPNPNGVVDFIQGATIDSTKGRLIFLQLEPFAGRPGYINEADRVTSISGLRSLFKRDELGLADKYAFDELYDSTITVAKNDFTQYDRFFIKGSYQTTVTSDISLNRMNVPEGSVNITAGGRKLVEGIDYSVDYVLGRVRILNESVLNSGVPISVNFESTEMFNMQPKRFFGTRFDYWISDNFTLGATYLNLKEAPVTNKSDYGDEPVKNSIWGLDGTYRSEVPFLTKLVDMLPLIETKEKSEIIATAEYAKLKPNYPKITGQNSFIDDFENSRNFYDLRGNASANSWKLASTPTGDFPEGNLFDSLKYGYNRANLSWYQIKNDFYQSNIVNPERDLGGEFETFHPYVRSFLETDIFPNRQNAINTIPLRPLELAFYPSERGPYNYDTDLSKLNTDGTFNNPEERWGGIMQALQTTDFEVTNYQYIEFWMLNPFYGRTNDTYDNPVEHDGKLLIQLGNISEDILKDGRILYEHALPESEDQADILDTTAWGVVSNRSILTNSFTRDKVDKQDLGYDGLSDESELEFHSRFLLSLNDYLDDDAYEQLVKDPSTDNFYHPINHRLFTDSTNKGILHRYKRYGRPEGNSTGITDTIDTQIPETEDLNNSNSLDDSEDYYEYEVAISPSEFFENGDPYNGAIKVDNNYIVDEANVDYKIGETQDVTAKWIQFQIPLSDFTKKVGNIQDFRSIRFIRMYLTGFKEPVIIRFARFGLVSNQWRKYKSSLYNGEDLEEYFDDDANEESFDISVVNIEENQKYLLPPGVVREVSPGQTANTSVQQNEQALSLKVCDLKDGDAKAAFKTENIDLRFFEKLKMHIRARKTDGGLLEESDITAFIRLGSDNSLNYYEYEVPLTYSKDDFFVPSELSEKERSERERRNQDSMWLSSNSINLNIQDLIALKKERNNTPGQNIAQVYSKRDYKFNFTNNNNLTADDLRTRMFKIKGNPDLSKITTIMIGVRNPAMNDPNSPYANEDNGMDACSEVWFNELRLSGFDVEGGQAALAKLDIKLADFGTVNLSGNMHTRGFGGIEQSISERYRDDYKDYSISTALELGKFLPKKSGITIPFYAGITESFSTPQYDPYTGDILLDDLAATDSSAKSKAQTYTRVTNRSFEGVKKNATKKSSKKRFHDISNLSFTYRYLQQEYRDPTIEKNITTTRTGIVSYNFNNNPKTYKPFKSVGFIKKSKNLKFLRDFNYQIAPKNVTFETTLRSDHNIFRQRLLDAGAETRDYYNKQINWNRKYGLKYTPAKSLTARYSANTNAYIQEPLNDSTWADRPEGNRFWNEIYERGRMLNYTQNTDISYKVPFKKFPIINWFDATLKYNTNFRWDVAPINRPVYGHGMSNGNTRSINASVNSRNLHKGLKSLGKTLGIPTYKEKQKAKRDEEKEAAKNGEKPKKPVKPAKKGKKQTDAGYVIQKTVLALKKLNFNYKITEGTTLPGIDSMYTPDFLGNNLQYNVPGYAFTFGHQPYIINDQNPYTAHTQWLSRNQETDNGYQWFIEKNQAGWFTRDTTRTIEILRNRITDMNIKMSVEPIKKLVIDLNWKRNSSENYSEFLDVPTHDELMKIDDNNEWEYILNPQRNGTYKVSTITWGTAFQKRDTTNNANLTDADKIFTAVNRPLASQLLNQAYEFPDREWSYTYPTANGDTTITDSDYKHGFGKTSQDVLIPAFIAAYQGKDLNDFADNKGEKLKNPHIKTPLPNWKIRYTGLSRLKALKPYFTRISINHSYQSTYSTTYTGNVNFDETEMIPDNINPNSGNYEVYNVISQVTIKEAMSPLIGFDVTTKSNLSIRTSYGKSRTLNLSFVNYQLNQQVGNDYKLGVGYKFRNVPVPLKLQPALGGTLKEVDAKLDYTIRDNQNLVYDLEQNEAQPASGSRGSSLNAELGYRPSRQMEVKLFWERRRNVPYTTNSFATKNWRIGVRFRYTL